MDPAWRRFSNYLYWRQECGTWPPPNQAVTVGQQYVMAQPFHLPQYGPPPVLKTHEQSSRSHTRPKEPRATDEMQPGMAPPVATDGSADADGFAFVHETAELVYTHVDAHSEQASKLLGVVSPHLGPAQWDMVARWKAPTDPSKSVLVTHAFDFTERVDRVGVDYLDETGQNVHESFKCTVMMANETDKTAEVLTSTQGDPPGLAVIDTACQRTMHGPQCKSRFVEGLRALGLSHAEQPTTKSYTGIGGSMPASTVDRFPAGIFFNNGEMTSACIPQTIPMLISLHDQRTLGIRIDPVGEAVDVDAFGVKGEKLLYSQVGHPAISLLDFAPGGHPGILDNENFEAMWSAETSAGHPATLERQSLEEEEVVKPPETVIESFHQAIHDSQENDIEGEGPWMYYRPDSEQAFQCQEEEVRQWSLLEETAGEDAGERIPVEESLTVDEIFEAIENRTLGNRKSKKVAKGIANLHYNDVKTTAVLASGFKMVRKLPFGKTWVKQLFAGVAGLAVIMSLTFGLPVGQPLDYELPPYWNAASRSGRAKTNADMQGEDPYMTVLTPSCGPWGSWSRYNLSQGGHLAEAVTTARKANLPLAKECASTLVKRVKAGRHILLEQPLDSELLDIEEFAEVRSLIENGTLMMAVSDGCQLGYVDYENGLPNIKPMKFITSALKMYEALNGRTCARDHEYGMRTRQAATWPHKLDMIVCKAIFDQSEYENEAAEDSEEGLPVHQRDEPETDVGAARKRPKRGRPSGSKNKPKPPKPTPNSTPTPEVPTEGTATNETANDTYPNATASGEKGNKTQDVQDNNEPTPSPTPTPTSPTPAPDEVKGDQRPVPPCEVSRRENWKKLPAEVRSELKKLHNTFGHPTNVALMRCLRSAGAKPEMIKAAEFVVCDVCGDCVRQLQGRPTRIPG